MPRSVPAGQRLSCRRSLRDAARPWLPARDGRRALAFVYGVMLGALREKAGGLLAPWTAHVLTDIVIASIVIALARA